MGWEDLTWTQQFLLTIALFMVGYAGWSLLALTWRLSNRVLAQAELYEAQAKFYEAKTEFIEAKTKRLEGDEED